MNATQPENGRGRSRGRSRRRLAVLLASALTAVVALSGMSFAVGSAPVSAASQGCGYANASANNGNFAGTTCWFDFTGFDETAARTTGGQAMQVTLSGGYVATFTAKVTDVAGFSVMHMGAFQTPLETRFAFGTDAYRGVPNKPALYSLTGPGNKAATIAFSGIKVVDALGNPVTGFSFVAADTEDNVLGESFTWSSDKPIRELERLAPNGNWGCKAPVGLGTTTVSCAGTGSGGSSIAGGKSTALIVGADSPTTFSTQWVTASRSGIAIGIQTSKLTLTKQVAGRVAASDSFDLSVRAPGGVLQGSASTGAGATATTGPLDVLPNGGAYTLGEAMTPGSPTALTRYQPSWSCTNVATQSTTVLPTGSGYTKTISPAIGDDIRCTVTNTAIHPALTLVKSATPAAAASYTAGQLVTYRFVITNTGDVPLTGVAVDDSAFSGTGPLSAISCPAAAEPLDPAEQVTCTATYSLTQADVDAGSVDNAATASATTPTGERVTTSPSHAVVPIDPAPAITLAKTADPSTAHRAGDVITYAFLVTNTGNVTLTNPTVAETAFNGSGTAPVVVCPTVTLSPGQNATCAASYTLTQGDADAGQVVNTATATATAALGANPVSAPSTATVDIVPAAALSLAKSASRATVAAVGDTVTYTFQVTNTGNLTLTAPAITETAFSGSGALPAATCPPGPIAPSASVQCTAEYRVTQADLDSGALHNTATATATPPRGPAPVSNSSSVTIPAQVTPALSLVKTSALSGSAAAGHVVTYSFLVTNTGNVTVSGLHIDETALSGTGTLGGIQCPTAKLAPTEATTCTAPYVLTQADVDAGVLSNTAIASGVAPGGAPVASASSTDVRPLPAAPGLSLVKSASPAAPADFHAGEQLTYSFVVTNTGNVTLTAVAVTDGAFSGTGPLAPPTCPAGASSLAPGAQVVCTTTYTVTQADVDAGSITNSATATAQPPTGGPITSQPSVVAVPEPPHPAATLVKSADVRSVSQAGQRVTYTFTVTNTGNTTLTDPAVVEGAFTGHGTLSPVACPDPAGGLLPGQRIECTATYTVVAADLTGRRLDNTATATAVAPGGSAVTTDPSTARVDTVTPPAAPADPADLAATGSRVGWGIVWGAGALVAAGALLLLLRRRREAR